MDHKGDIVESVLAFLENSDQELHCGVHHSGSLTVQLSQADSVTGGPVTTANDLDVVRDTCGAITDLADIFGVEAALDQHVTESGFAASGLADHNNFLGSDGGDMVSNVGLLMEGEG